MAGRPARFLQICDGCGKAARANSADDLPAGWARLERLTWCGVYCGPTIVARYRAAVLREAEAQAARFERQVEGMR